MIDLACHEIDLALAVYAVDGLSEDDRTAVVAHLAECRLHDGELAGLRETTTALAAAVPSMTPRPSLRASLLDTFETAITTGLPPASAPMRSGMDSLVGKPSFAYAIAAALLVIAIGLAAWATTRGESSGAGPTATIYLGQQDAMLLQVVYVPSEGVGVLKVDMPALAAERTYQAWRTGDGEPVSMGLVGNKGNFAFQADLGDATAITLTVEPAGGSVRPSGEPIIVSRRT
jgi:anti-sigma-K factor RskA